MTEPLHSPARPEWLLAQRMTHTADCSICGNVSSKVDDATRERLYDEDDARRHAEDAYTEQACSHPRSRKGDRYCLDCGARL